MAFTNNTFAASDVCDANESSDWEGAAAHAARVSTDIAEAIHAKYLRGQREHGGRITEKAGMLAHVEAEARDSMVYLHVLREQLADIRTASVALTDMIDAILGEPEE